MITSTHLSEGLRFLLHNVKVKTFGYKKYRGDAKYICRNIVKDCWNGQYFQTSTGHYRQFWSRDFSWCVDSLMKLGWDEEVLMTLLYALAVFSNNKGITTTITPSGRPYDFPDRYAPDSLASIMYALKAANAKQLVKEHLDFLDNELEKFYNTVVDKGTGLVRRRTHFSSMRDHYVRDSSCYDNVMVAWLAESLKKFRNLFNPFKGYNLRKLIKEEFWTGTYFLDDLSGSRHITGDANVFPLWTGLFNSKEMIKKVVFEIESAELDRPMPLKYSAGKAKEKAIWVEQFVPNWEKDSVWPHMGMLYLELVKKVDKGLFEDYYDLYKKAILKHKTFLEVYDNKGKPYSSLVYSADEGMLWCANFLTLKK